MNLKQSAHKDSDSSAKLITEEQLNECMEFCTMFNVFYAMHQFPIPLRNIDLKKKKTSRPTNNSKLQNISKEHQNTSKEHPKAQTSKVNSNKKTSKFQKPKTTKKQPFSTTPSNYQTSQVDNYHYQNEQAEELSNNKNYTDKGKTTTTKNHNNKRPVDDTSPPRQIDLAALISGLAVGSNNNKQPKNYSPFDQGYGKSAIINRDSQDNYAQSRLYQQDHPQTPRNQHYHHYEPHNTAKTYHTNQPKYMNSSLYPNSNPYSKAQYQNPYSPNTFMTTSTVNYAHNSLTPYANQIRAFNNNNSPFNQSQNISKNLFSQGFSQQNLHQFNNFDPFGYQGNFNQNQSKNNLHDKNYSNNAYRPHQSKLYETPSGVSNVKSPKTYYQDDKTNPTSSPYTQQSYINHPQHSRIQNTPPKTLSPSNTQRSLSPLGNSASCRNFFALNQKQISVDRNRASRSKSRRKQKPGGSKSFYQPSSSARKVISRQKPQDQRDYQPYQQQVDHQQRDIHTYNRPSEFNIYNREAQQSVKDNKRKAIAPTQYPRNTGQTDFSAISGWQQPNHPQKSTKSQQLINNKTIHPKNVKHSIQQNQTQKDSPRLAHQIQPKHYNPNHYDQDNDVDLDDLQEEMEKLNTSRRKVPKPITEIDLTNTTNPKVKLKK